MQALSENIIQLQNLSFGYSSNRVLSIANLEIKRSEKVFLFGSSGCGKSTLLEILSGIQNADSGRVQVLNQNLVELTAAQKDFFRASHIGYIFQNFNLIPYLSVQENILLPIQLSAVRKKKVQSLLQEDFKKLTHELQLDTLLDKKSYELSIGEQQRVAVARALLGRPELILADEPTSALDYVNREKFLQLMFDLCDDREATLIFVSHDLSLKHLFSRVIDFASVNQVGR